MDTEKSDAAPRDISLDELDVRLDYLINGLQKIEERAEGLLSLTTEVVSKEQLTQMINPDQPKKPQLPILETVHEKTEEAIRNSKVIQDVLDSTWNKLTSSKIKVTK